MQVVCSPMTTVWLLHVATSVVWVLEMASTAVVDAGASLFASPG